MSLQEYKDRFESADRGTKVKYVLGAIVLLVIVGNLITYLAN